MVISDCWFPAIRPFYTSCFFSWVVEIFLDICNNSSQHKPSQPRKQGEFNQQPTQPAKRKQRAQRATTAGRYPRAESIPSLLPGGSWSCHGGDWSAWGRMECSKRDDLTFKTWIFKVKTTNLDVKLQQIGHCQSAVDAALARSSRLPKEGAKIVKLVLWWDGAVSVLLRLVFFPFKGEVRHLFIG